MRRAGRFRELALLGVLPAGAEEIRVRLLEVDGTEVLDVRRFIPGDRTASGEPIPTTRGVMLSRVGLEPLLRALIRARDQEAEAPEAERALPGAEVSN